MYQIKSQSLDKLQCDKEKAFIPHPVWTPQSSPSTKKKEYQSVKFNIPKDKTFSSGEGNLSRILSGAKPAEVRIIPKQDSCTSEENLIEKKENYIRVQLGGDPPFHGFRTKIPKFQGNTIYRARNWTDNNNDESINTNETDIESNDKSKIISSRNNKNSRSISCIASNLQTEDFFKKEFNSHQKNHEKSISMSDLTSELKKSAAGRPVLVKNNSKLNKGDIYERLNLFILKKLENINGPSKKYHESNINIHYETPVLLDQKMCVPEDKLAEIQANQMLKVYEETKKNKILKEQAINESRKHTDNFTLKQKNPIDLHRYDNDIYSNIVKYKVAKAVYDFHGSNNKELSFKKGDILMLYKKINNNWYEGEICGKMGIVPCSYVEILSAEKNHIPKQMYGIARFNFKAQSKVELDLCKGDKILITRKIDENWFEGQLNDRKGIFPCSYVFLLSYNDEKLDEKFPHNFEILANKNHQTKELSNSYLYKVLYSYKPQNSDELELKEGEVVQVLETCDDGWFIGSCQNKFGTFPGNYVEKIYK